MIQKTTVLENYEPAGDHECFCFDLLGASAHNHKSVCGECRNRTYESCTRIYPDALLPEVQPGTPGKWTITVTFEAP